MLRCVGKSEDVPPGSSLFVFVDVDCTDLIPKSAVRMKRASGRFIFELFSDLVPNVTSLFADMVRLIAEKKLVYECGNNEPGFRCVWNQYDQKLDEAAQRVGGWVG